MKWYSEGPEILDIRYTLLSFAKLPPAHPAHTQCEEPTDSTGKQVFFKTQQIKKLLISLVIKGRFALSQCWTHQRTMDIYDTSERILIADFLCLRLQDTGLWEGWNWHTDITVPFAMKKTYFHFYKADGCWGFINICQNTANNLVCFNFKRPQYRCDPTQGSTRLFV